MNKMERQMRDILLRCSEKHGVCAVKAEFEAEGTRMDELLRLVEVASAANLRIAVKIGGCEAKRDLLESKQIGVEYVIAPMVESAYALSKFSDAINSIYQSDELDDTSFLFNLETSLSFESRVDLADMASESAAINGIVFGRVDFTGSLGLDRFAINTPPVTEYVLETAQLCKDRGLDLVVGGGVGIDALPALREIRSVHLSRFETRKVIFQADSLDSEQLADGLLDAVHFEVLWLLNKREYYGSIFREDDERIEMLESRWNVLKEDRGR